MAMLLAGIAEESSIYAINRQVCPATTHPTTNGVPGRGGAENFVSFGILKQRSKGRGGGKVNPTMNIKFHMSYREQNSHGGCYVPDYHQFSSFASDLFITVQIQP